jgi:replication initiation protein RepC
MQLASASVPRPSRPTSAGLAKPGLDRARLYQALDNAHEILRFSASAYFLAKKMIGAIRLDAPKPISALRPCVIAKETGVSDRQVRRLVGRLVELRLVRRATLAAGGRGTVRGGDGELLLFGIDFQPLLDRADEFRAARLAKAEADRQCLALRKVIGGLRSALQRLLPQLVADSPLHALWAALPRRLAALPAEALQQLAWRCQALLEEAEAEIEGPPASLPVIDVDRSQRPDLLGPTITTTTSPSINPVGTGKAGSARQEARNGLDEAKPSALCGVQHVTLAMALHAAPEEWQAAFTRKGSLSWETLVRMAQARLQPLGINRQAWTIAMTAIGPRGAALLVLVADANHVDRGGEIRRPGAWMRAMAELAAAGEAQIHRSIFGILRRTPANA